MPRLIIIALLMALFFNSCALDEENIPDETDPASAFIGSWSVSDNSLKLNYTVTISRNPLNSTEVILNNFAGSNDAATGLVTGKTITVLNQQIGSGWYVGGSGTYKNESRLEFTYDLEIAGNEEKRLAIFTR